MKTRSTLGTAALLLFTAIGGADARKVPAPKPPANANDAAVAEPNANVRPKVEVVFVLDTTGSMSGLIQGAKDKIWSIARHVSAGQPRPDVKIGIVAYRDVGDAYVTKKFALTGDLDAVFENLMSLNADGGGDTPEHVSKGLHDAVYNMDWAKDSMKMVFLVGDAPPHTDYGDGLDYNKIVKEANRREIRIHAIRCGGDGATAAVWSKIARNGRGTYASIAASGGVVAMATPHDAEMAELGRKLNDTAIIVGEDDVRARVAAKAGRGAAAAAPAAADRAGYYATSGAGIDSADFTARPAEEVAAAKPTALPAEMRRMSTDEKKAYVVQKQAERAAIVKELETVSRKRDAYLREQTKDSKAEDGFDAVVDKAITEQAKEYGMKY